MSTGYELELAAAAHGHAAKEITERPLDGNADNIAAMERVANALLTIAGELRRLGS